MIAAQMGNTDVVEVLLAHGANMNVRRDDGKTALGLAKSTRHALIAQRLREAGAVE
jgi:ankyrin repeat protein